LGFENILISGYFLECWGGGGSTKWGELPIKHFFNPIPGG